MGQVTDSERALLTKAEGVEWDVWTGDALESLVELPHQTFDLVITELPQESQFCGWNSEKRVSIAQELRRVLRPGGAIWTTARLVEEAHKWHRAFVHAQIGNLSATSEAFYLDESYSRHWTRFSIPIRGSRRNRPAAGSGVWMDEGGAKRVLCDEPTTDLDRVSFYASQRPAETGLETAGVTKPLSIEFVRYLIEAEKHRRGQEKLNVLDPFAGCGSVGAGAILERCDVTLIEIDEACAEACRCNAAFFKSAASSVAALNVATLGSVVGAKGVKVVEVSLNLPVEILGALDVVGGDLSATCRAAFAAWLGEQRAEYIAAPVASCRDIIKAGHKKTRAVKVRFSKGQANVLDTYQRRGYDIDESIRIVLLSWLLGFYDKETKSSTRRTIPFGGK